MNPQNPAESKENIEEFRLKKKRRRNFIKYKDICSEICFKMEDSCSKEPPKPVRQEPPKPVR